MYDLKNGPGLLSPKFFQLIEKNKEGIQYDNLMIASPNVPAPVEHFVIITSAPLDNQPASTMGIYSNGKGTFTIQATSSQNPHDMANSSLDKGLTLKEVNKRIDKAFFPNEKTRKTMKQEIINLLEELEKPES